MKAELKFDLDNSDDREAHLRCVKATDMACILFEFSTNSRKRILNKLENHSKDLFPSIDEVLDIVFEEFNGLMEGNDINIDELIS